MSEAYFKLDNLSVGYNGKALIHDINIDIKKGEIVTLIGPNGSGKSTILKSITRQLKIIEGLVVFDQNDITKMNFKDLSKKMAVVLTDRIKPELMTCHDLVATGRYPYTGRLGILSKEDEEIVENAMKVVHAEELGNRDFSATSDGQKQRVLLARAIAQQPDIILLDEPTSFLDIKHKLELLNILRTMAKENGITVIMSLHEIDLAQKIADRVICVKGDVISLVGEPEGLFTKDAIRDLYDIENGSYDPVFGSIELPKPVGEPKVFVLSSCGTGIKVYRKLQKEGIPFCAGILYENDIDYQLASVLSDDVINVKPFEEIPDEAIDEALKRIETCDIIINAGVTIGTGNKKMETVLEAAKASGKLR